MTIAAAYSCVTDRSADTGSLVACTCGFAVGPFLDHERALSVASDHRNMHSQHAKTDAQRARRARP